MQTISGKKLKQALVSASNNMSNNKSRIDAMNVFPVPDGDTGSNMGATIEYAISELANFSSDNVSIVAKKFARGMLLGARGNSGVILSQIFKGFSEGMENKEIISQFDLVQSFKKAKEYAYKSVMQPVEGTILTVIRMVSEELSKTITANNTIVEVFDLAARAAKASCLQTPEFLDVLKEVGITDSGGEGLLMILEGISKHLQGSPIKISSQKSINIKTSFLDQKEDFTGNFGYCTEFIVELKSPSSFNKLKFQNGLEKMGDSIVVVHDEEILKTHVHTLKPGVVLNYAQKFGDFTKIKSENMNLQANESHKAKKQKTNFKNSNKKISIGVISCNIGPGIIKDMEELGVNFIIEAGQSSNPSAKDFIEAIASLKTDKIIILPNNKNIILVAQQVVQTTNKDVVVIPTQTQMQGIVAMMNFDREGKFDDVRELMEDSLNDVKTGQVTKASRTTKIDGVAIKEGEFLAIADGKIISSNNSKTQSAVTICKKLIDEDTELVTIYYGNGSTEIDAEEVASYIEMNTNVDVEIKNGAQPTYSFLIAFE